MIINAIKDGVGITGGGSGGGAKPPVLEQLNATENGTYTPSDGVDGFNPVEVNVTPNLQTKSININENGAQTIEADSDFYGLDSVNLNIDVQPSLQAKSSSTTITENGTSTITLEPDANYDGLSLASVTITTNVESSGGGGKYVVPNGMKFGYSTNLNIEDFDMSQVTDVSKMFYNCNSLISLNLNGLGFSNVTDMSSMFNNCSSLTSLGLSNFDTSKVTDMQYMFYNCSSLPSLGLSNFDTSKVTNMQYMFYNCSSLPSLDLSNFDTSKVTDMSSMFNGCMSETGILNINGFSFENVNKFTYMFNNTYGEKINMNNVKFGNLPSSSSGLFYGCKAKTITFINCDTSKMTTMETMFGYSLIPSLDLSNFDTSNVTNMNNMFQYCSSLTSLGLSNFDTSKVTNMGRMFYVCEKLPSLDLSNFDTSSLTNMPNMFEGCISLTSLNLSGLNLSKVTNMGRMFNGCKVLTDINMNGAILPKTNLTNWKLDYCTALTVDSLVSVLNALQQLDEGTSYTCTIGSTNLNKLSDTQKAIATNKGWVLN